MGRPTTYNPETAAEICERVVMRSLRAVCQDEDMPAETTVYGWLKANKEFLADYTRACEVRGFRRGEDLDEVMEGVRSGDIKPDAGRVLMDGIRWQAGKENRRFADKQVISNDPDAPFHSLTNEQLDAKIAERLASR
jgi:hypothetical protein